MPKRTMIAMLACAGLCGLASAQPVRWRIEDGGNGHYYERIDTALNWNDARSAAEARSVQGVHGYLATITSAAEGQFIIARLGGESLRHTWLGGYQPPGSAEPGAGWSWITGEAWDYSNWAPNQPDNFHAAGEDCLEFIGAGGSLGTWNDFNSSGIGLIRGYVVEYPVPTGTVAYYHFDEQPGGAVASGAGTLVDASGNGHAATPIGGPVYRANFGAPGGIGLDFDGVNDRVFIPDHPAFELTDSLTVEAYIRIRSLPTSCCGGISFVFRGDDRVGLDPYVLSLRPDGRLVFDVQNAAAVHGTVTSPAPVPFGALLHVAGRLDGSTGELGLYINGQQVAIASTPVRPLGVLTGANPGLGIGNVQSANYAEYFDGLIDEVRISNVALATAQMLPPPCYANCDGSYAAPLLNVNDFGCFLNRFAAADPYANCDGSTTAPLLNVNDFVCFLNRFAAGCP